MEINYSHGLMKKRVNFAGDVGVSRSGLFSGNQPYMLGTSTLKNIFATTGQHSRSFDPNANYDIYLDRRPFPYPPLAVAAIIEPYINRTEATSAEIASVIARLREAIKANEAFGVEVTDYYGMRVSRTSGGKRDRLRSERAAIREGIAEANRIAASSISALQSMKVTSIKASLPLDPDTIVSTRDPASGAIAYTHPVESPSGIVMRPIQTAPGAPAAAAAAPGWLLPAAAGAIALFMLNK